MTNEEWRVVVACVIWFAVVSVASVYAVHWFIDRD